MQASESYRQKLFHYGITRVRLSNNELENIQQVEFVAQKSKSQYVAYGTLANKPQV